MVREHQTRKYRDSEVDASHRPGMTVAAPL